MTASRREAADCNGRSGGHKAFGIDPKLQSVEFVMRIVADENMPLVEEFFGEYGEITRLSGREMCADQLRDADILLVRSVTPVNAELLEGSRVRFVGTATIGFDHIDRDYLDQHGIGFASAPGSNAESVVDWVLSSLLLLDEQDGRVFTERVVGVVGAGNVGGRLLSRLRALGVTCLVCDPPRAEAEGEEGFVELDELLERADVVSLHTPLVSEGRHATFHLLNEQRIEALRSDQVLISAGRGDCVDSEALKARLQRDPGLRTVIDVWENEPAIDEALYRLATIATPHVAGYSLEGKMLGSEMLYQAVSRFYGLPARRSLGQMMPENWLKRIALSGRAPPMEALRLCARSCYDVRRDALLMERYRRHYGMAEGFDLMRKEYPLRREYSSLRVELKRSAGAVREMLEHAGFSIRDKRRK